MDAKQVLLEYKNEVDVLLNKHLADKRKEVVKISPDALVAFDRLTEYTLRGGKRLRAALIYYTYKMMGGKKLSDVKEVSIFIELIQSYLLIHDDVMDQDSVRRGKPTVHKIYEEEHRRHYETGHAGHFGESMAINIGDLANHLAMDILSNSNFSSKSLIRVISHVNRKIGTVTFGQMFDILGAVRQSEEKDILLVHKYKTATYTYETPMYIGAILAGATDEDLETISKFAIPAGIAFQIQDDILGMFGDEYKLGKSNTSDLKEGKQTLLITKAFENASRSEVAKISRVLGNKNVTQKNAEEIRNIIIKTGSLGYSKNLAVKYVTQAKKSLEKMPDWNGEGRAFLDGIADYMISREF